VIEKNSGNLQFGNLHIKEKKLNEEYSRQGTDIRGVVAFNHSGIADDSGAI